MRHWPRPTIRGQCFLGLGAASTAVGMLLGFPDITRAGVLLLCLPLLALLTAASPQPALRARRTASPAMAAPGAAVRVALVVRNVGRRRSAPRLARERVEGGRAVRFALPAMSPGEQHTVSYEVSATERGRHPLGPLALVQRDPFGLTSRRRPLAGQHEFLVLPAVEELAPHDRNAPGPGRDGQLPHLALHGEDDMSIRDYRQGDDLRRVHWPTTAHRGELMVRQAERPARQRAVLVLDTRAAAFEGAAEAFEWAVSAVASLAVHLDARGYAVHVVGIGPQRDRGIVSVLRGLALAETRAGDLAGTLREAQALTEDGAVVIAVLGDRDAADALRLAAVRSPGSPATALLLDTASYAVRAGRAAPGDGRAAQLTEALAEAGWRCRTVTEGDSVGEVWHETSAVARSLR